MKLPPWAVRWVLVVLGLLPRFSLLAQSNAIVLPEAPALSESYVGVAVFSTVCDAAADINCDTLSHAWVNEVHQLDGLRLIEASAVQQELKHAGLSRVGCDDVGCQARLARYAGAHYALLSELTQTTLTVRLFETDTGQLISTGHRQIPQPIIERSSVLRSLAVQLLVPQDFFGSMEIGTDEAGVEVYVDGKRIGETPLKQPLEGLAVGLHRVRLIGVSAAPVERLVAVAFRQRSWVRLPRGKRNLVVSATHPDHGKRRGLLDLSELSPGLEVRVDAELRMVTSLLRKSLWVAEGAHTISLSERGMVSGKLDVTVRHGFVYSVGLEPQKKFIVVRQKPMAARDYAVAPYSLARSLIERTSSYAKESLTLHLPSGIELSGMRAVKVAGAGYFTREMRRLSSVEIGRPPLRTPALHRERARWTMVETRGGSSVQFESWHWIAAGGAMAFLATGTSLVMYDSINRGALPRVFQAQRFDIPGFTDVRFVFNDDFVRVTLSGQW